MLIKILGGFLMALADSVPGVSGGTIAFILGLYDDFINSLHNIVAPKRELKEGERKKALLFLLKLGSGWVVGMILAALVITSVFEKYIYQVSSLFLGFVLFSIPLIVMEEKETLKGQYWKAIFAVLGVALVVGITVFSKHAFLDITDLRWENVNFLILLYLFFAAMCAISAMVLPGISGSTIMLVFGVYQAIMMAIKGTIQGVFTGDFSYIPAILVFGFGVIAGIATIVKVLREGLLKQRTAMVYFIIGMMIGSLYAIVQGPTAISNPLPAMDIHTFCWWMFLIGGAVIFGLQMLKRVLEKKQDAAKEES